MRTDLYTITTLSNLHVGSGDINFDIIDNQVQKDAITKLPNINSSSLKGAFREAFDKENSKKLINYIFEGEGDHGTGAYSFFEAQLLSRPVRSSVKSHFNATAPFVIKNLLQTIEDFNISMDEELKNELQTLCELKVKKANPFIFEKLQNPILEDTQAEFHNITLTKAQAFLGDNLALFEDSDFKELTLPVIARNYLVDGVSKNLWYEEVVPKRSKFFFCIAKPTNLDEKDKSEKLDGFENRFNTEGSRIQFGANKSIGYGFSKVAKVSL